MPYHFTAGRFQALDNSGAPLASGRVYTYAAGGGTTPKTTYTTQAGGTPNANPVVLDSSGRAEIWLGSGAYRILVTTAAGVTISDTDNIRALEGALTDSTSASNGAGLIPYSATLAYAAGTVGAKLQKGTWVSVLDYGATGDGTTNDADEIQAAIDAVYAAGGGVVWLPRPTTAYNLGTTTLTLAQNVHLIGAATRYANTTAKGVTLTYSGTGSAIYGASILNASVQNLDINCSSATGSSVRGLRLYGVWLTRISGVSIRGVTAAKGYGMLFEYGDVLSGAQHNIVELCECADGIIRVEGLNSSQGPTTMVFNTIRGMQYEVVHGQAVFINATAESWGTSGTGYSFDGAGTACTMIGCDIENTNSGVVGITVTNSAKVFEFGTVWNGFSGTTRVSGALSPLTNYGGELRNTYPLTLDTAQNIVTIADNNATYAKQQIYPANVTGGAQDGYWQWKRLVAGTERLTHEFKWHAIRHHTRTDIANSASTVLTITIPTGGGVAVRAVAWGTEGAAKAVCLYDIAAVNDGGTVSTPVIGNSMESPATGMVFTAAASSNTLLIKFEHGNASASTVKFAFEILGEFSNIATTGT